MILWICGDSPKLIMTNSLKLSRNMAKTTSVSPSGWVTDRKGPAMFMA